MIPRFHRQISWFQTKKTKPQTSKIGCFPNLNEGPSVHLGWFPASDSSHRLPRGTSNMVVNLSPKASCRVNINAALPTRKYFLNQPTKKVPKMWFFNKICWRFVGCSRGEKVWWFDFQDMRTTWDAWTHTNRSQWDDGTPRGKGALLEALLIH